MDAPEEQQLQFDVIIVGAGPSGLSAAIRIKQRNPALKVAIFEKGATIGAHILSGNIFEPTALKQLFPEWQPANLDFLVPVTDEHFYFLSAKKAWTLPIPPSLHNKECYITSLGKLCQWLGTQAENLGVELYPGFPAATLLMDNNRVIGIQTGDVGRNKQGQPTTQFQAGVKVYAPYTLLAEGARGHLSEFVIRHFELRKHTAPQTYALGFKEIWQVPNAQHQLGSILHTIGAPLMQEAYGGGFLYHYQDNQVLVGLIIGLDYKNPHLDLYQEFQNFKRHPTISKILTDGRCTAYGARALTEGGVQAIPTLDFPGGALIGCAAGFMNVAKLKGTHTAMGAGILAADSIVHALETKQSSLKHYNTALRDSWIYDELFKARNIRPAFNWGLLPGMLYAGLESFIFRGRTSWTLTHPQPDYTTLKPAKLCIKPNYPKPDNKITFDKMTALALSQVYHEENEPCHLQLKDANTPIQYNLSIFDAPEQRYCPAGVYEIIQSPNGPTLQINAPNCIHCKTCDIKDPTQNIHWTTPQGGEGPHYGNL